MIYSLNKFSIVHTYTIVKVFNHTSVLNLLTHQTFKKFLPQMCAAALITEDIAQRRHVTDDVTAVTHSAVGTCAENTCDTSAGTEKRSPSGHQIRVKTNDSLGGNEWSKFLSHALLLKLRYASGSIKIYF